MPQINISKDIDASFLAGLAGLSNAWGSEQKEDTQLFAFMSDKIDAVEQALLDYPAAYLEHRKAIKLDDVANIRRLKELVGPAGLTLDDKTVARLTAASVGLQLNPSRTEVRWELTRGNFVTLPRDTVLGIAIQAFEHVQACFETVYEKTVAIQAVSIANQDLASALLELDSIDLTTGWPQ